MYKLKNNKYNCLSYSIDRFSRIQLPLASALLLIGIGNKLMSIENPIGWYLFNFISLQGVLCPPLAGPLWSLAYEVWFYILAGAMAAIITFQNTSKKIIAFMVMMLAMVILSQLDTVYTFLWIMGAFASRIKIDKNYGTWVLISGFGMVFFSLLNLHVFASHLGITVDSLAADIVTLFFGLSACLFVVNVIHIQPASRFSLCINQFGEKMAKFSYTLYLTHWTVLVLMLHRFKIERTDVSIYSIGLLAVGIICSHIVAYLLYRPFESQSYRLKVWMKSKLHVN